MKALIDGDVLCYAYGSLTNDEGNPLRWDLVINHLNAKIKEICDRTNSDEYHIYLTGEGNFRETEATIKPYKGNRDNKDKPFHFKSVRKFLLSGKIHPCTLCKGIEADDGMAIAQMEGKNNTTICTIDKDLLMVPGRHYGWSMGSGKIKEREAHVVSELDGMRWFFKQLLMGDTTDNILGLYNVGKKSALVTKVDTFETVLQMYQHVQDHYEKRFGSYWEMFMHENARLLWMLQSPEDDIRIRLVEFHKESFKEKELIF